MDNLTRITFTKRPIPIPAEYRPLYKIAQLLQVLYLSSRGKKASLLKLHLFSWAFKSKKNMQKLESYIKSPVAIDLRLWGLEPSLNRALVYAISENLCRYEKGNYVLTNLGEEFIELIYSDNDLLKEQRFFLNTIGKSVTEKLVNNISKSWKS